jgi:hypothetical protein
VIEEFKRFEDMPSKDLLGHRNEFERAAVNALE